MSGVALAVVSCGLAAAIAWGVCDYWAARAARSVGPATSVIAVNTLGALAWATFYLVTGQEWTLSGTEAWYAVGGGFALGVGQIAFFQALKAGPVSLVSPLSSAYPLVTTVLVLLFFHVDLSAPQLVGIAAIMLGIVAASDLSSGPGIDRSRRGPLLALATAASWGAGYALMAQALETVDWRTASVTQLAVMAATCLSLAPLVKGDEKVFARSNVRSFANPLIVGAGLVQTFGMIVLNVGMEQDAALAAAATAVSACYPVLTILLAVRHFGEDVRLVPLGGAALTIAGVVVITLG